MTVHMLSLVFAGIVCWLGGFASAAVVWRDDAKDFKELQRAREAAREANA